MMGYRENNMGKYLLFSFKCLWFLKRKVYSSLLSTFYRIFPGVFFKKLGKSPMFYGPIRFGSIGNNNIIIGNHCAFGKYIHIGANKNCTIIIDDEVSINTGCHIVAIYGIRIGKRCSFGEYVSIRDQNHTFKAWIDDDSTELYRGKSITIGNNVWVGRGCIILPGVTIGDYSVIGANSVVSHDIPEYSLAVGSPAKVIRDLRRRSHDLGCSSLQILGDTK
jgi:acetyltransferase-like isoleucine patch superfamily enzyme